VHINHDETIIDLTYKVAPKKLADIAKVLKTKISVGDSLRRGLIGRWWCRGDKERGLEAPGSDLLSDI
jgi:hypothetical protein